MSRKLLASGKISLSLIPLFMSQPSKGRPTRRRFTGAEAAPLDLRTAARWTAAERRQNPDQTRAYFFGRDIIEKILAQPDCQGLRVHYAMNPNTRKRHLLIVGADADQNDQLPRLQPTKRMAMTGSAESGPAPAEASLASDSADLNEEPFEGIIAEMAIPCPNQCGNANLLNGYAKG